MRGWEDLYRNRLVDASEAVKVVKSGDRVVLGHACGEPRLLPETLVSRWNELENVEILHRVDMGEAEYANPEMAGHFRLNSLFAGPNTRKPIAEGRADYTPCFISEIPGLFKYNKLPIDVAMVTVTPPDRHGYFSLGISVDYTKQAVDSARVVVAEVNPHMPWTCGNSIVHVSDIDYFVPCERPLIELKRPAIGPVEKEIGRHVASLVADGATMQMGIGAIPDAVLSFLTDKHDLGIHTEMFSDGVMDLVDAGVITCKKKTLHPGKIIANFLMGTKEFYRWVDRHPLIEMHPEDYVNDPYVIGRNDHMVAVNSALQVDVMGQAAADTLGPLQFSGVGGQVDFVRGAARSPGGKSILAFPSTAAKGKLSRIVVKLDEGACVTTSRNDIDYVVTEYGIADLKGKTVMARMDALISVAHPDFRNELKKEARKLYFK